MSCITDFKILFNYYYLLRTLFPFKAVHIDSSLPSISTSRLPAPYTGGMIVIIKLSMSPMNADALIPVDQIKNEPILSGSRQLYFGSTLFGSLHRQTWSSMSIVTTRLCSLGPIDNIMLCKYALFSK